MRQHETQPTGAGAPLSTTSLPALVRIRSQLVNLRGWCRHFGTTGILLVLVLGGAGTSWSDEPIPNIPDPVTLRPSYERGDILQYNMRLAGQTAWTPKVDEVDWGRLDTKFNCRVCAKIKRPSGAWTFDLHGERLRGTGETSKGKIDVTFTETGAKIKPRCARALRSKSSPFERPMTLTVGPRGEIRFGMGLAPLAVYLLPQVDARFWTMLTKAPEESLELGDHWQHELQMPVPGARGEPLRVDALWRVLGFERYKARMVIAIGLVADIEIDVSRSNTYWVGTTPTEQEQRCDCLRALLNSPSNSVLLAASSSCRSCAEVDRIGSAPCPKW
ncbi:MAG: hypothetical protein O3A00_26420 [Planctomycetota bacterium]|nr:hypothetical protein [Planctomycetota bacterium]